MNGVSEKLTLINLKYASLSLKNKVRNWRNSKEISKFFILDYISKKTHADWIKNKIDTEIDMAFIIHMSDKPVGLVYLRKIDNENKTAEYGIFLNPKAPRKQGVGTLATRQILEYGFKELNLHKIYLEVFPFNKIAINLYKKFNFQLEASLRQHIVKKGKRVDLLIMGLLKKEWLKNENPL